MSNDIQIFKTPGADTWTKPTGAKIVHVFMMPGGQGGDNGGAFGAGTGNPGNGAQRAFAVTILADDLAASETVAVGAGGVGSLAGIAPSGTNAPGGFSQFGDHLIVSDPADLVYPDRDGNIDFTQGTWTIKPGAGGSGGSNTGDGSAGGDACTYKIPVLGGTAGVTDTNGGNGADSSLSWFFMDGSYGGNVQSIINKYQNGGGGGGGGGGETSVAPGNGGNGGWPGGGGGGGGEAAEFGSANGGAGGDGGDGVVVVITECDDSAGGGGGLTAQQTRDAMKLAPSTGAPDAGSVDAHLDSLLTNTSDGSLTAQEVRDALKLAPTVGSPAAGSVDAHLDSLLVNTGGAGATAKTLTFNDGANPVEGAEVWVTTDSAGTNIVASGVTDSFGQITFYLDAGTYYVWQQISGFNTGYVGTTTVT